MRWAEETSFRELKYTIGLVHHCINNQVMLCHQRYTLISPLEGFCHKIVLFNKPQDACLQFINRFIALPFKQAAVYDAEPYFNLVHPWTMLWRVYNTYPVFFLMKEFLTAFQAFQYSGLPFAAKVFRQAALLRNKPYQTFWFMRVQAIADKCPWCIRVCFDQCTHGFHKICFCTCGV